jgi:hypothetical protein
MFRYRYIKPPYASIHCTIHIQIHMPTSPAASPVIPRSICCAKAPRNAGRESAPARSFVQVLQVLASGVGLLVGLVTVRTVGWWISMDINGYTWIQMRSTQVPYGLKNHLRTSAHPMESPFSNSECFLRALYQWHLLLGDGVTNVGIADLSVANPIPLPIKESQICGFIPYIHHWEWNSSPSTRPGAKVSPVQVASVKNRRGWEMSRTKWRFSSHIAGKIIKLLR